MKKNILIAAWFTLLTTTMFGFITRSESSNRHSYSFTAAQMDK